MCSVLCLHDFESDDPDHFSFRTNEILDIVKQETTGWWAAMRQNGNQVGWIPSAFVAELQIEELNKLQKVPFEMRVYEYDTQRLHNSAPLWPHHMLSCNVQSPNTTRGHDWVPVVEATKVSPILSGPTFKQLNASQVSSMHIDPVLRQQLSNSIEDADSDFMVDVDVPLSARLSVPPSPLTPTPQPPPITASLLIGKLTQPTPIPTPVSNPQEATPNSPDTASASLSGRIRRRRPVLLDDRVSLSRLSTLMGANDMKEVEILTSPQISGSFDAFSRALVKKSDEMIQPFAPDAVNDSANPEQFHMPWYLRPSYSTDTLQICPQGRVKAGTLSALIERLTEDSLSKYLSQ
jgi:son of sevenless-like protein